VDNLEKYSNGICLIGEENLKIYIFSNKLPSNLITKEEEIFSKNLKERKKKEFIHSRYYARYTISKIFKKSINTIPLNSPPGKPPILPKEFGFLSFSHCVDALVVAWSKNKIGVDVERIDRKINPKLITKKIFTEKEMFFFSKIHKIEEKISAFLEYWVIKESLIKRERGSIFRNINNWEWDYNSSSALNLSNSQNQKVKKINFHNWVIGIAN